MATLTVGAGQTYATLSQAVSASHDGDVIKVQAGYYWDDFSTITHKITIQGVNGMAYLVQSDQGVIPNGKAILTTETDVTIDHIGFIGAHVPDQNGAGIRYEGGALTVTNSYFTGNQDGILGAAVPGGSVTIKSSEFTANGIGDGHTHNLYLGDIATADIEGNFFHDAIGGHEIKSRAETNIIKNNRIVSGPAGTNAYSIDLPDGGNDLVQGNFIEKGAASTNSNFIHYGGEGGPYAGSALTITGNTVLNDETAPAPRLLLNETSVNATVSNNAVWNLTSAQIANGPATVSGTTTLASEPALDLTHPWAPGALATGPDTVTLYLSEDAYNGNAAFVFDVDGVQQGLAQSVTALHSKGQTQAFTFKGNWGAGTHTLTLRFINDAYGGTGLDRNLYISSLTYDGTAYAYSGELGSNGAASGTVTGVAAKVVPQDDALVTDVTGQAGSGTAFIAGDSVPGAASLSAEFAATPEQRSVMGGAVGYAHTEHAVSGSAFPDLAWDARDGFMIPRSFDV